MNIDKEINDLLNLIKEKRKEKGYTQADIANYLGITQQAYTKIESGTTDLKLKTLYQIAEYLGIDISANKSNNSNLVAINPTDIVNDISSIKREQNDMKKGQDDMNQKLDELLDLFKKKKK